MSDDPVERMPSLRLLRALYRTLDADLAACYRYVEPTAKNSETYSVEFMRLHAQACMGLGSLLDLWYEVVMLNDPNRKEPRRRNIQDYLPIVNDSRVLIDLQRGLEVKGNPAYVVFPFKDWTEAGPPKWWDAYNDTKHHLMLDNFPRANLDNALNALGGFYIVLHDRGTFGTHPLDSSAFKPW